MSGSPGGHPCTTAPRAGPWDSPHVVTSNRRTVSPIAIDAADNGLLTVVVIGSTVEKPSLSFSARVSPCTAGEASGCQSGLHVGVFAFADVGASERKEVGGIGLHGVSGRRDRRAATG